MIQAVSLIRNARWLTAILAVVILFAALVTSISADGPAQDEETAKFETEFMQKMIDHHHMAAEMAKVCLQKAMHDELRVMCQTMVDAQTKEIQDMQAWLAAWYQIDQQPMMMAEGDQMMQQLNAASGDEFDKMLMEMMIEHHSTAIQEATPCIQRAAHEELKNLCQNIITSQQQEINQMQAWLAQWYNITTGSEPASATNPTAPTMLPQTGGAFQINLLAIVVGLLVLGVAIVVFRMREQTN